MVQEVVHDTTPRYKVTVQWVLRQDNWEVIGVFIVLFVIRIRNLIYSLSELLKHLVASTPRLLNLYKRLVWTRSLSTHSFRGVCRFLLLSLLNSNHKLIIVFNRQR